MEEIQFTSCTTTTSLQDQNGRWCVLLPHVALHEELFLSKNGVVLIYGDVASAHLKIVDQLLAIASNILRPGRGLVTGGTWPLDITYDRVVQEKGIGFRPGEEFPDAIRTMAWQLMGQEVPTNYGKLDLGLPLSQL